MAEGVRTTSCAYCASTETSTHHVVAVDAQGQHASVELPLNGDGNYAALKAVVCRQCGVVRNFMVDPEDLGD